ncbi:hypothetical protein RJ639_047039 [Escallonia herrerae]|uniref:Small auxin up regulated protein n=1 Tax=Escallonia herrerae TaxID=1293975 RepID=A0AA89AYW4_9ASTE|nr:hypothetical protein RJ639_047039 [Escallonia herrerae]
MASALKKVNKITQIVRLKQVMQRWRSTSLRCRPLHLSHSSDDSDDGSEHGPNRPRTPSGSLAVYADADAERRRFVIPTRFLNLPVLVDLLDKAEEEFGYQSNGGLVLPCEAEFFAEILKLLVRDEQKFGGFGLDEFCSMFSDVGFGSCKDSSNACHGFAPLLQKTRA